MGNSDETRSIYEVMLDNDHFTFLGKHYGRDTFMFLLKTDGSGDREPIVHGISASGMRKSHLPVLHGDIGWWNAWLTELPDCEGLTGKGADNGVLLLAGLWSKAAAKMRPYDGGGEGRGFSSGGDYSLGDSILTRDGRMVYNRPAWDNPFQARPALLSHVRDGGKLPDADPAGHRQFADLCEKAMRLRLENPLDALIIMGWFAAAPFYGALEFANHVYCVGARDCGKSTFRHIALALYGHVPFSTDYINAIKASSTMVPTAVGTSSFAGLRTHMGSDALPVFVEEAETDTGDIDLVKDILRLLLNSIGNDGAEIKGTSGNEEAKYFASSMLAMLFSTSRPRLTGGMADRIVEVRFDKDRGMTEAEYREVGDGIIPSALKQSEAFIGNIFAGRFDWLRGVYGDDWEQFTDSSKHDGAEMGGWAGRLRDGLGRRQAIARAGILAGLEVASGGLLEKYMEPLVERFIEMHREAQEDSRGTGDVYLRAILAGRPDPRLPATRHDAAVRLARRARAEGGKLRTLRADSNTEGAYGTLGAVGMRMRTDGSILLDERHVGFQKALRQDVQAPPGQSMRALLRAVPGVTVAPKGVNLTISGNITKSPLLIPLEVWNGSTDLGDEQGEFDGEEDTA